MASLSAERAGILILRAWVEDRSADRLRVRVTQVAAGQETPVTTTLTVEGTCQVVRDWLETVLRSPDSSG